MIPRWDANSPPASRCRASRSRPRSTPTSRRRPSPHWASSSAGSPPSTPSDGSVQALAGVAFSAPQPPGSTFKIVTTSAALEDGKVSTSDEFPIETAAVIEGREVANAHDEPCGGTFSQSFAKSCNSVFAPLGVEVGAERLVEEAEQYGFNARPALYNDAATKAVRPPGARSRARMRSAATSTSA